MTLSTAKLLKENGWFKPCITNYHIHKDGSSVFKYSDNLHDSNYIEVVPAPSTDELLAELPRRVQLEKLKSGKGKKIYYRASFSGNEFRFENNPNPSEALALLWIKLKQENIGG